MTMTNTSSAAGIGLPTDIDQSRIPTTPRDVLREALERQVAAKIVALLPPDDRSARHILALAGKLYDDFISIEACSKAEAQS